MPEAEAPCRAPDADAAIGAVTPLPECESDFMDADVDVGDARVPLEQHSVDTIGQGFAHLTLQTNAAGAITDAPLGGHAESQPALLTAVHGSGEAQPAASPQQPAAAVHPESNEIGIELIDQDAEQRHDEIAAAAASAASAALQKQARLDLAIEAGCSRAVPQHAAALVASLQSSSAAAGLHRGMVRAGERPASAARRRVRPRAGGTMRVSGAARGPWPRRTCSPWSGC